MPHVLVVDDDPAATHALGRLLREDGHRVSAFTSPHEALQALKRWPFDIVITDLEMPELDGHAILRAAREHQPNACIVVVSGKATEHAAALIAAGACVVSDKPVDYAALTSSIERCRAKERRARHAGAFVQAARR